MEARLERRPASAANRCRARWLSAVAVSLAWIAAAIPSPASAAVTLGQLAPAASPDCEATSSPGVDYLQPSITGGNLYIARQAGTITSWSTNSSGVGATYVFKVFRRTSDPDVFQVIAHAPAHLLGTGVNTTPVSIPVRSGDMIGINERGDANACTFSQPGDGVLMRPGSVMDGGSGTFAPRNDVRLNLSAVLVPSNAFTISALTRDRKLGSATVTVSVPNPGILTLAGKTLKKRHVSKNIAVARIVSFQIAAAGKRKRKLDRTGKVAVTATMTYLPAAGESASTPLTVKLIKRVRPPASLGLPNAK
jgi:hypothetical protein